VSDKDPVQLVLEFYEALRDSRIEDMLALTDPTVVCQPLVRPGLTMYSGHDGMVRLDHDMHAAHGRYQLEFAKITEQDGKQMTVEAVILPKAGLGEPLPVTTVHIVRDGLITWVESLEVDSAP
jgi:hypothetical protein